jgi:hypothetical protein
MRAKKYLCELCVLYEQRFFHKTHNVQNHAPKFSLNGQITNAYCFTGLFELDDATFSKLACLRSGLQRSVNFEESFLCYFDLHDRFIYVYRCSNPATQSRQTQGAYYENHYRKICCRCKAWSRTSRCTN